MHQPHVTFVQERRVVSRYLTKICDQLVCLLSSKHSQAIVWEDKGDGPNGTSLDLAKVGLDRLFDFMVAKKSEQEENVIARQGFTVRRLYPMLSLRVDLNQTIIIR